MYQENVNTLKPQFYMEKLGFAGVYLMFLNFLSKTHIVGTR